MTTDDPNTPPVVEPSTPPVVEPPTPKVVDPPTPPDNDLRDVVANLAEQVTSLAATVAALAPLPDDETPVHSPWTHKRIVG